MAKSNSKINKEVLFREPRVEDGADIWRLVKSTGVLDVNSAYTYLMLSKYFSKTCIVAEQVDNNIVGFVSGFKPHGRENVIFIWQVAVSEIQRGKGLGFSLLKELIERLRVEYLETTITPSNKASQALFNKIAKEFNAECKSEDCFTKDLFPDNGHEEEMLYTIGPLNLSE